MNSPLPDKLVRLSADLLAKEISDISAHPLVNALMNVVGGLFAVMNEHRQVVAINRAMLDYAGVDSPDQVLGFRNGEILGCVHVGDEPSGCGASDACNTCGSARSLLTCLENNTTVEDRFALTVSRNGILQDLYLQVRAVPLQLEGRRIVLLFMQDVTQRQSWAALESTFFHDIGNLLNGLIFSAESLVDSVGDEQRAMANRVLEFSQRVAREFSMQRTLVKSGAPSYEIVRAPVQASTILQEITEVYLHHPRAQGRFLDIEALTENFSLVTDASLFMRVAHNMITNALEATDEGGSVKVRFESDEEGAYFSVWNAKAIPIDFQKRIFQRNFTTKSEEGHGLGTFSMKLFGEKYLGGKVSFTSDPDLGTEFLFSLPLGIAV